MKYVDCPQDTVYEDPVHLCNYAKKRTVNILAIWLFYAFLLCT
jgi:hypothetical protein